MIFTLNYHEHYGYIIMDNQLFNRSINQDALENDPDIFTEAERRRLKSTDKFVFENVEIAADWVRRMVAKPNMPDSHWWWHLNFIADGVKDAPKIK